MCMATFKSKPCATCQTVFTPTSGVQKYCELKCKPKFSYTHTCTHCGAAFKSKQKKQVFCSQQCYGASGAAAKSGAQGGSVFRVRSGGKGFHPNAPDIIKDGKFGTPNSWSDDRGYILYYWDHPSTTTKRVHEHRAVAYAMGHSIAGMHIDHIDTDRGNNDPSNLQVLTPQEHMQKTATFDGSNAFWVWVKENNPQWIEEWRNAAPS